MTTPRKIKVQLKLPAAREGQPGMTRGWWNMACWNGLSAEQQHRLITVGNLPIDYRPQGTCPRGAQVAIETEDDEAPGPRFYCRPCAIEALQLQTERTESRDNEHPQPPPS